MRDKNIEKAKEIFLKYDGSHFQMERDESYEQYKSFNISEEQEREWLNEYQDELLQKIKSEDGSSPLIADLFLDLHSTAYNYIEPQKIDYLLKLVPGKLGNADSFTKLLIAEIIRSIVELFIENTKDDENDGYDGDKIIIGEAKRVALSILENIIDNPITINEHYRINVSLADKILKEEEIVKRVKEEIEEWAKM